MDVTETDSRDLPTEPEEIDALVGGSQIVCPITRRTVQETEAMTVIDGIFFAEEANLSAVQRWQAEAGEEMVDRVRQHHQDLIGQMINHFQEPAEEHRDADEYIERTDTGISIEHQMTRGTGTRDQDKITTKVKQPTLGEALVDLEQAKTEVKKYLRDVRNYQPDSEEDDNR